MICLILQVPHSHLEASVHVILHWCTLASRVYLACFVWTWASSAWERADPASFAAVERMRLGNWLN